MAQYSTQKPDMRTLWGRNGEESPFLSLKMVEPRGVEPLSCDVIVTISTCLFRLCCFSSSGFADRQAAFRLSHLKSRTQTDEQSLCARTLLSPSLSVSVGERTSPSSGECVLFVRSYWFDR